MAWLLSGIAVVLVIVSFYLGYSRHKNHQAEPGNSRAETDRIRGDKTEVLVNETERIIKRLQGRKAELRQLVEAFPEPGEQSKRSFKNQAEPTANSLQIAGTDIKKNFQNRVQERQQLLQDNDFHELLRQQSSATPEPPVSSEIPDKYSGVIELINKGQNPQAIAGKLNIGVREAELIQKLYVERGESSD